jgi:hypothetical protein
VKERNSYDEGWKEVIEVFFPRFLQFFFPQVYAEVDFDKGFQFLDKELERIVKKSLLKKRFADKLVKVFLKDGSQKWILIHIEVQGFYDVSFEKRMYIYNYRIFDRYDQEVVSLSILADADENYRPSRYEVSRWGFRLLFEFPVVKLLDYLPQRDALEQMENPFAVVVLAHLTSLKTKRKVSERFLGKVRLVKMLYEKRYTPEEVWGLYRFIDWVISLPEAMEIRFHDEITQYEEVKHMPYITTAERIGIQKGIQQGKREGIYEAISFGLELKFGLTGLTLMDEIRKVESLEKLEGIKEAVKRARTLEEMKQLLASL